MTIEELRKALKDLKITKTTTNKILTYFEDGDKLDDLNTALYQERLSRNHKMVKLESKGSRGYNMLIWIHPIVEQLAQTYNRTYMEMARAYIKLGINKMVRGYGINKFKYYNEDILQDIEQRMVVGTDPDPEITLRLFKYYCKKVFEIWEEEITRITGEDKYHLIKFRNFLSSRELKAKPWIDERFEKYSKSKKPMPVYMLYAEEEDTEEKVDIKHSKLSKIING